MDFPEYDPPSNRQSYRPQPQGDRLPRGGGMYAWCLRGPQSMGGISGVFCYPTSTTQIKPKKKKKVSH